MRRPFIAGNWKMFKTAAEARAFIQALKKALQTATDRDIVVCAPFTSLPTLSEELRGANIGYGAQNVHWEKQGAYTGEISTGMLAEWACKFAIVGHSERRQYFAETDTTVNKRMHAALAAGITPIVCIGETLQEREGNAAFNVIERQVAESLRGLTQPTAVVIAYEPVWAIGTGKTATPEQAQEVHAFIRKQYAKLYGDTAAQAVRILYGGSIKPDNMASLMKQADIDGGLVGGASLEVDSFTKIVLYDRQPVASK